MMPYISIILPTFNRKHLLKRALESVFNQTYKDFEVVVINDGGMDVKDLLLSFDESKIIYINHDLNKGIAASRNSGLKAARGKYIAYLDDDDIYYPDHLETLLSFLEKNETKVAYTDALRVYVEADGNTLLRKKVDLPFSFDFDPDLLLIHNLFPTLTVMHGRECLSSAGLFDESLRVLEDWEFWIRMSRHYAFHHVKKITGEFTKIINGTSITRSSKKDFYENTKIIYDKYRSFLVKKDWLVKASEKALNALKVDTSINLKYKKIFTSYRPGIISAPVSVIIEIDRKKILPKETLELITSQKKIKTVEIILVMKESLKGLLKDSAGKSGVKAVVIPDEEYTLETTYKTVINETKGDFLIFMNSTMAPANKFWIYNIILPFLNHESISILTLRRLISPKTKLYDLWINSKLYEDIKVYGDFFFFIESRGPLDADEKLIINLIKKELYFPFNNVFCVRKDSLKINDPQGSFKDHRQIIPSLLMNDKAIGFLNSTGFYEDSSMDMRDLFWSNFREALQTARVPAYFYTSRSVTWESLIRNMMEAYRLIKTSIKKTVTTGEKFSINSFINILGRGLQDPLDDKDMKDINVITQIDEEIQGLLNEITGHSMKGLDNGQQVNLFIGDFINHLGEFAKFIYNTGINIGGRDIELIHAIYQIFVMTAGENMGIYYLEKKSLNSGDENMRRVGSLLMRRSGNS